MLKQKYIIKNLLTLRLKKSTIYINVRNANYYTKTFLGLKNVEHGVKSIDHSIWKLHNIL